MPGTDYGVDRTTAIMTAADFNDNLRAANVIGCAYGEKPNEEIRTVIPVLSLVVTDPEPLKQAFLQFKAWIDATGPDALNVEILYSGSGYHIAFGPTHRDALWRTIGLDQLYSPMYWGLTYIKNIDSRQTIVDQLANYARHPVAPVLLRGAMFGGKQPLVAGRAPSDLQDIPGCPELMLLRLPVYKSPEEVPRFSGLNLIANPKLREELASSREQFASEGKNPGSISAAREGRLSAFMPVTMHMLRAYSPLKAKVDALLAEGVASWQVEQAIVNQRLWSLATVAQRARFHNRDERYNAFAGFVEVDNPDWDAIGNDRETILKQILRDARFLLRSTGRTAPSTLPQCQVELGRLGYLTSAESVA